MLNGGGSVRGGEDNVSRDSVHGGSGGGDSVGGGGNSVIMDESRTDYQFSIRSMPLFSRFLLSRRFFGTN